MALSISLRIFLGISRLKDIDVPISYPLEVCSNEQFWSAVKSKIKRKRFLEGEILIT